jgi:hypothetical protein
MSFRGSDMMIAIREIKKNFLLTVLFRYISNSNLKLEVGLVTLPISSLLKLRKSSYLPSIAYLSLL